MDRKDIIERVRKLYAMSQDVSSPHEADIANRRCRKLMDEHGIKESDLSTSEFLAQRCGSFKKRPKWFSVLSLGVAMGNDCILSSSYVRRDGQKFLDSEFRGFEQDVLLANMMLEYLIGAMDRSWKEFSKEHDVSGKAAHYSFNYGFAGEMQRRLYEMAAERKTQTDATTGRSLVVVKTQLVVERFGRQLVTQRAHRVSDRGAGHAGVAAARRVGLNTQVSGSGQRLLA